MVPTCQVKTLYSWRDFFSSSPPVPEVLSNQREWRLLTFSEVVDQLEVICWMAIGYCEGWALRLLSSYWPLATVNLGFLWFSWLVSPNSGSYKRLLPQISASSLTYRIIPAWLIPHIVYFPFTFSYPRSTTGRRPVGVSLHFRHFINCLGIKECLHVQYLMHHVSQVLTQITHLTSLDYLTTTRSAFKTK